MLCKYWVSLLSSWLYVSLFSYVFQILQYPGIFMILYDLQNECWCLPSLWCLELQISVCASSSLCLCGCIMFLVLFLWLFFPINLFCLIRVYLFYFIYFRCLFVFTEREKESSWIVVAEEGRDWRGVVGMQIIISMYCMGKFSFQ